MSNDSLNPKTLLEGLYDILKNNGERLDEKSVSKAQQKFMGMVHAAQKGEKPASPEVAKVAKSMGKKDAKDFAKTKHKGLPSHVTQEETDVTDEGWQEYLKSKRSERRQNADNPWEHMHKTHSRHYKTRIRKEEAGVGKITAQNTTCDVDSSTPQKNLDAFNLEEAFDFMYNDMLEETKLRKGSQKAIPNIETWDSLDNNNSPYLAYRYGVSLAGAPADTMDKHGPVGGKFVTIGYTEEDRNIIKQAAKSMGIKPNKLGSTKSEELSDVNKTSAVANIKKNKYGI